MEMPGDAYDNGMVLVMGVTGSGKSTFINSMKPGSVEVGHGLEATQSHPQAVQIFLDEDDDTYFTVVDTPGFDDTHRLDGEILAEISGFLAAQYAMNIPLKGIIYLHRITDNKMTGSAMKYLETFRFLCGDHALKNVILVTTCWNAVSAENHRDAVRREQELIDNYWEPMLAKGSYVSQFNGSKDSAEALVLKLIQGRGSVVLDVQRELVDLDKEVGNTQAGMRLGTELTKVVESHRERLVQIDLELGYALKDESSSKVTSLLDERDRVANVIERLEGSQNRMRAKIGQEVKQKVDKEKRKRRKDLLVNGVSVFAAVVSITLTVVKFVAFGGM